MVEHDDNLKDADPRVNGPMAEQTPVGGSTSTGRKSEFSAETRAWLHVGALASLAVVCGFALQAGEPAYAVLAAAWFALWWGIFYAVTGEPAAASMAMLFWFGLPAAAILAVLVLP